ncbi:MAG: hypothetical protein ABL866_06560 [Devosia sp.]
MYIQKRTMNWLPKASLFQQAEAARLKRKSMQDAFLSNQDSFATSFGNAQQSMIQGTNDLITKIALSRIQKKA